MEPAQGTPATQLIGGDELRALMRERKVIIAPLLDERAPLDHIGLDLRLDCFFREFVRTQNPYVSPADNTHSTTLREVAS